MPSLQCFQREVFFNSYQKTPPEEISVVARYAIEQTTMIRVANPCRGEHLARIIIRGLQRGSISMERTIRRQRARRSASRAINREMLLLYTSTYAVFLVFKDEKVRGAYIYASRWALLNVRK